MRKRIKPLAKQFAQNDTVSAFDNQKPIIIIIMGGYVPHAIHRTRQPLIDASFL